MKILKTDDNNSAVKTLWFLTLAVISVSESNVLIKMMWIERAKYRYWHEAHNDTNWVLKIGFTPQRLVPFVVQRPASDKDKVHARTHTNTHTPPPRSHKLSASFTGFDTFDCVRHHRSTQDMYAGNYPLITGFCPRFLSVVNWISRGFTKPCNTWGYEREFII